MNAISAFLYQFWLFRKLWWKYKKWRGYNFNDREKIQVSLDSLKIGDTFHLPAREFVIDHTIYLGSRMTLAGSQFTKDESE